MSEPREEVQNVRTFIEDSLIAAGLPHVIETSPESPNTFVVAAWDNEGYVNTGIFGWNEETKRVRCFAFDPVQINHNEAEGVEDGKAAWETKTAEFLVAHLVGEVRKIQAKYRALLAADEKPQSGFELDSGQ